MIYIKYCPSCKKTRRLVAPNKKSKICKPCLYKKMSGIRWRKNSNGYLTKQVPFGKRVDRAGFKRKFVYKHRWLMEKHLGRKLRANEIVHHKNHIKTDNRIQNLEIMTMQEHIKHHSNTVEGRERRRQTALKMHKARGHKITQTN